MPMQARLEQYGQRSVHPLIDLANYVMIELGQPLHIYEASAVDVPTMAVRAGRAGECLDLLDGTTVALTSDDLVVADRGGVLALAGVLGGRASAVDHGASLVVEAGRFRPHLVRRTARRHGLLTEAALRSSKLLPPELASALGAALSIFDVEAAARRDVLTWLVNPLYVIREYAWGLLRRRVRPWRAFFTTTWMFRRISGSAARGSRYCSTSSPPVGSVSFGGCIQPADVSRAAAAWSTLNPHGENIRTCAQARML